MSTAADLPRIDLNDGTSMPLIGFGVFQVPADETDPFVHAEQPEPGSRLLQGVAES